MDDVPNDEKEQEDKEEKEKGEKIEDMEPQQQLYYFCKTGKTSEIKAIAKQKIDINGRDEQGTKLEPYITKNTALHYAVLSGSLETVQVIYNLEASLDVKNKLLSTPLHVAASLGYTEIVKYLCDLKADIEAKNVVQNTPLHCAIYAGHVSAVKILLNQFDDPRQALMSPVNGVGMSPVKYTAHDDMKKYLKQFFPKKNNDENNQNNQMDSINPPSYNDTTINSTKIHGNDVQEEELEEDEPDETAKLTETATATEQ
eukprot:422158_1